MIEVSHMSFGWPFKGRPCKGAFNILYRFVNPNNVLAEIRIKYWMFPSLTINKMLYRCTGEKVVVGAGDSNNSHVELWTLTSNKLALHRLYQVIVSIQPNLTADEVIFFIKFV